MNDLQKRREAYAELNAYINKHRNELKAGGNQPETIFIDMEDYLGRQLKDWTLADYDFLTKMVKDEVEVIVNRFRRNPLWKRAISRKEVIDLS